MSGGSFNYLCYNDDFANIVDSIEDIESMVDYLRRYGYPDIATDCQRLVEYIKSAKIRVETLFEILKPVFKAVEWYASCDIGEDTLIKALEKYRHLKVGEELKMAERSNTKS